MQFRVDNAMQLRFPNRARLKKWMCGEGGKEKKRCTLSIGLSLSLSFSLPPFLLYVRMLRGVEEKKTEKRGYPRSHATHACAYTRIHRHGGAYMLYISISHYY